jgi:hypothetical protein
MGWTREQQQELINKQKNSQPPKTRNKWATTEVRGLSAFNAPQT